MLGFMPTMLANGSLISVFKLNISVPNLETNKDRRFGIFYTNFDGTENVSFIPKKNKELLYREIP